MCNTKTTIHPRCKHPCSISPPLTTPCPARYSDPIYCDILTTKETIPHKDLPFCDECYKRKKRAVDDVKAFFRKVDRNIVEQGGWEFAKEDVGRMRRVNVQVRRSEVGWWGRGREEGVWEG